MRHVPGGQHPIHVRTPRDSAEEILLDAATRARQQALFQLSASPDRPITAASSGAPAGLAPDILFPHCESAISPGATISRHPSVIRGATGGDVAWAKPTASTSSMSRSAEGNHRPSKVFLHRVGTAASADVLVYEADPGFFVGLR